MATDIQSSKSFPPVVAGRPRVLILGSLPGQRSLEANQYYAQARNSFWPIMGELFGAAPELPYPERKRRLTLHAIALWDVVASARRPGSLDSNIDRSTMAVNDLAAFLARYPSIRNIFFNGKMAAELYERHVLPALVGRPRGIPRQTLPSTSPAHAAMSFAVKLERWSAALAACRATGIRTGR